MCASGRVFLPPPKAVGQSVRPQPLAREGGSEEMQPEASVAAASAFPKKSDLKEMKYWVGRGVLMAGLFYKKREGEAKSHSFFILCEHF